MRTLCLVALLALVLGATAQARTCTPTDAEAADAAVDHLDSWADIDNNFRKYGVIVRPAPFLPGDRLHRSI